MLNMLFPSSRFAAGTDTPGPAHPFWYSDDPHSVADSGDVVTAESAMRVAAVSACVRVLSEAVATLPLFLYERTSDGSKRKATSHQLYDIIHDFPNTWQTSVDFWEQAMMYLTLRGNAVAEIQYESGRMVLEWIHPRRIIGRPKHRMDNSLQYTIADEDGRNQKTVGAESVMHVRGLCDDGVWGLNPIAHLRNSIGMAMGAEQLGNALFRQGIRPSGVFSKDGTLSEPAYDRLKTQIAQKAGSGNAAGYLLLEDGLKWYQMSITPEDAQFLETRKFQTEEIARIFRVPMHMINVLDRATFSNIEHMGIEFVVHTLRPWLVRIEKAIKRDLILQKSRFFAEFNVEGLLRGDTSSRYDAYASAIQNEWMSKNEVRQRENLNPVDGGDEFRNPAINPQSGGSEPQPVNPPQQQATHSERLLSAYVSDIAGRIANHEMSQLTKRTKHASEDRERFDQWATEFYGEHAQYVDAQIGPLCDALESRSVDRVAVVEQLTAGSLRTILDADDPQRLASEWQESRHQLVTQQLQQLVT